MISDKCPLIFLMMNINVTAYPFLGGLMGNDMMRRFNIVFNYPEKRNLY